MRKGFKQLCNVDGSTSTLNRRKMGQGYLDGDGQPTLQEMLLQLELEEVASKRATLDEYGECRRQMSCVNSSDIVQSARKALNQYPRFSLDGKDAMCRSSFRNTFPVSTGARNSLSCIRGSSKGFCTNGFEPEVQKFQGLPATIAGESVVWCRPGVVAKLMGLEAMPIPVLRHGRTDHGLSARVIKGQDMRRRRRGGKLDENERTRFVLDTNGCCGIRRGVTHSYRVMRPLRVEVERPNELLLLVIISVCTGRNTIHSFIPTGTNSKALLLMLLSLLPISP